MIFVAHLAKNLSEPQDYTCQSQCVKCEMLTFCLHFVIRFQPARYRGRCKSPEQVCRKIPLGLQTISSRFP